MENSQENTTFILADVKVFDFLKEKAGDRKTKTEAYWDLPLICPADAFDGWQRGADKELYAFVVSGDGLLQLLDAAVDGVAFEEIFFQDLVGPASE